MKITGAATVFPVTDVEASARFFTDVLGFRIDFRFDTYAGVERDGAMVHLSHHANPNTGPLGTGAIYIFCDEVDAYFAEIKSHGAAVDAEPKDYPYGMRDFVAFDPDHNRISFGCPTKKSSGLL